MSVSTSISKVSHTLTTGSQALTVPFRFLANSHIKAIKAGDTPLTLVEGTDYTLTGAGASSGTLTTIATTPNGLAAGSVVVIKRNVPLTQETSYTYNGDFPSTVQEAAEDKLTMIAQQVKEQAERALHFPEDDTTSAELPSKIDRALTIQGYDANGAPAIYTATGGTNTYRYQAVNVAAAKATSYANFVNNEQIFLGGYYAAGDGGGGPLYVDKADTTTADNGVTVFVASDGTRLKRSDDTLSLLRGGCISDWNGSTGTDNTARVQAVIDAAPSVAYPDRGAEIIIDGRFKCSSGLTVTGKSLTFTGGGELMGTMAGTFITVGQDSYVTDPSTGYYVVEFVRANIRKNNTTGITIDNKAVKTFRAIRSFIGGGQFSVQSIKCFAGLTISQCRIQGASSMGVRLLKQNNIAVIEKSQILGTGTTGEGLVIESADGDENSGIVVKENDFEGWDTGCRLTSIASFLENITLENNWFETIAGRSIDVTNENTESYKRGIKITGNTVTANAGDIRIGSNAAGTGEISGVVVNNYIPDSDIVVQGANLGSICVSENIQVSGVTTVPASGLSNSTFSAHALLPRFAVAPTAPWGNAAAGQTGEMRWDDGRIFQRTATGWFISQAFKVVDATTISNLPTGATPSVAGLKIAQTANGGATSITAFTNGYPGQEIVLVQADSGNTTLVHGANLVLKAGVNKNITGDTIVTLICRDGTKWIET